jgi:hypothetical protein
MAKLDELAGTLTPVDQHGRVAEGWLVQNHGHANNAARQFCSEMRQRGLMAKRTEPVTIMDVRLDPLPIPCDFYQWNEIGRSLYEHAVNEGK